MKIIRFLKQNKEVMKFFNSINYSRVHKVYPHKVFCDEETNLCSTHDENNFFFFDNPNKYDLLC